MEGLVSSRAFTTTDCLNQGPEPIQAEVLAEALRIIRGETMMLATKRHLVALAEVNAEMLAALQLDAAADKLERDDPEQSQMAIASFREAAKEARIAAIAKAEGR